MVACFRRHPLPLALLLGLSLAGFVAMQPRRASASASTISFGTPTPYPMTDGGDSVTVADLDGDGHLDIVFTGQTHMQVLFGNGDGTFQVPTVDVLGGDAGGQIFAADLNGDGLPDLVTANTSGGTLDVVLNLGHRNFSAPTHYPIGNQPFGAIAVDLNNDGFPDLVGTNTMSGDFGVLINDKTGHFATAVKYGGGYILQRPVAADLNGDGNMDLVFGTVESTPTGKVHVWLGDGTGKMTHAHDYDTGGYPAFCDVGDFNGDGFPDLAVDDTYGHSLHVFSGRGDGSFVLNAVYASTQYPSTIRIMDLNGDGLPDLVWADEAAAYFSAASNLGSGAFNWPQQQFNVPGGQDTRMLAIGDFDEDGRPDVVVSDTTTRHVNVFLNTSIFPIPNAPSNLRAPSVTPTAVQLTWTNNGPSPARFVIEGSVGSGAFTSLGTVPASTTTFIASGLSPNTVYSFRVKAQNVTGSSGYSNVVTVTTPDVPPSAPSGLSATPNAAGNIVLLWTDNSNNESSFEIDREGPGQSSYVAVAAVGTDVTTYTDASLSPNSTYSYQIRATNAAGASAFTAPASALTYPAVPFGLAVSATARNELDLSWTDPNPGGAATKVERSVDGGHTFQQIHLTPAGAKSYGDTGLASNTSYSYRIRSTNASGDSAYSGNVSATTLPDPPPAPTGLQVTPIDTTSVRLTWSYTTASQTGFRIDRKQTGAYAGVGTVAADARAFTDSLLPSNSRYTYRVVATNAGGDSPSSNEVSVSTLPLAPVNASVTVASSNELDLNWSDPNSPSAPVHLDRAVDGSNTYQSLPDQPAGTPAYVDTNVGPGHSYTYRVRCYNASGGSTGATATGVIPAPPPAPASVTVTAVDANRLQVSWVPGSDTQTGFKIQRQNSSGGWDPVAAPGAAARTLTDDGRTPNTAYTYRVVATNVGGDSSPSNPATGLTLPAALQSLSLSTGPPHELDLRWNDPNPQPAASHLERSADGGATYAEIAIVTAASGGAGRYADTGLLAATQYTYRVRAGNSSGFSSYAATAAGTTLPPPPAVPSGLTLSVLSQTSIRLDWLDADRSVQSFLVERQQGSSPYQTIASPGAGTLFLNDTNLTANTTYSYRVSATGPGGTSNPTPASSATTPPYPPSSPTGVTAAALSDSSVTVSWTPVGVVQQVTIERHGPNDSYQRVGTVSGSATSYTDHALTEATTYTYRVWAANSAGQSSPSTETSVATLPIAPTGVSATAVGQQILLTWENGSAAANGFAVERRTGSNAYAPIAQPAVAVLRYVDDSLSANTAYTYRVRSLAGALASLPSGESTATTTTYVATGKLSVSPTHLTFGTLRVGATKTVKLKLTNKGTGAVTVLVLSPSLPFSAAGGTIQLATHGSQTVMVTCSPTASGTFGGDLLLLSSDALLHQAHVSLTVKGR